jgi:hypothetical protein
MPDWLLFIVTISALAGLSGTIFLLLKLFGYV